MGSLFETTHNPDVLSCIANLSNDEVFTPPELVNQMLDMLPAELWSDPQATFLDPACKSGVFLREIAKRLIKGLEDEFPDLEERLEHIYKKQLYGIAITELTSLLSRRSLYCSKWPNSVYSIVQFDNPKGNIDYMKLEHSWEGGRCRFCGAAEREYKREEGLEQYAYEFIHLDNPEEVLPVKFDVIIGNPPYQMSTGGTTAQAIPQYDKFVDMGKSLNPRHLIMIIPSRWFAGGIGLEGFRQSMLMDRRIRKIVDYPNSKDCFPTVNLNGGVCYFLWDRDNEGDCSFTSISNGRKTELLRRLDEFPIFVRYNEALDIIHKVMSRGEESLSEIVSSLSPFGIGSSERGREKKLSNDLVLFSSKGKGFFSRNDLPKGHDYLGKYHVMMSKAISGHAGEPGKDGAFKVISKMQVLNPGEICTFSYFIIGDFDVSDEARNLMGYLSTKFARFLLLQAISSINISKDKFCFVPMQDFSKSWDDEKLYDKYGLTDKEISFIELMMSPMDLGGESND